MDTNVVSNSTTSVLATTTTNNINNEIKFWSRQMGEHLLFFKLGIVTKNMDDAVKLAQQWLEIHKNPNQEKALALLEETINYKEALLKLLASGEWTGWISFSFVEHTLREARYFYDKLRGIQYTLSEELDFWLWHHVSENEAEEKLLDPKEQLLSSIIKEYNADVDMLRAELPMNVDINTLNPEVSSVLLEFAAMQADVGKRIKEDTILTNISPQLAKHVLREAIRALEIFGLANNAISQV